MRAFSRLASSFGLAVALALSACGAASSTSAGQAVQNQSTPFSVQAFVLPSKDGTHLVANAFVPQGTPGQRFPAIVFVNSWALGSYEYLYQAKQFAQQGYIALSYSTRGFGLSDGFINVAGPKDLEDLSAMLDWLQANTPVDSANIGMTGISYGAGISLLGASLEPRVKTAVAMSGFTDLQSSLAGNDTPRLVWGLLLLGSGYFSGRMDPEIATLYKDQLTRTNLDTVNSFVQARSPRTYLSQLNAAQKPIYLSNNLSDDLFPPNAILDYFSQLTGPKRLDLNRGEHTTAEAPGLLGESGNYVWKNAHDWFDYWLKGVDTGIMRKPPLSIDRKFASGRVELDGWPASNVTNRTFYLQPRGLLSQGKLSDAPNTETKTTTIWSGLDTIATSGFPLLSSVLEAHTPFDTYMDPTFMDRLHGVVYESDSLDNGLALRGKLTLHARIAASGSVAGLVAYFYDVNSLGIGKLLTNGAVSVHDAVPGAESDVELDASALVHDIAPGHRLAVAIDTFDLLYAPPTLGIYSVDFLHSPDAQATLDVQVATN